jgi:hypothetical protein
MTERDTKARLDALPDPRVAAFELNVEVLVPARLLLQNKTVRQNGWYAR